MAKKKTFYGAQVIAGEDQTVPGFKPDIAGKKTSKGDSSQQGYTNMRPAKGPGAKKLGK